MTWLELINPGYEARIEAEMFRLARNNYAIALTSPVIVPAALFAGLHQTLPEAGLKYWLAMMAATLLAALFTWRVLHSVGEHEIVTSELTRRWRTSLVFSVLLAAVSWASLGALLVPGETLQNTSIMLVYLAIVTSGGSSTGVYAYRLYFIVVAISLAVLFCFLPQGFGENSTALMILLVIYPFFVARSTRGIRAILLRSFELQFENERLLEEKTQAAQRAERERIYRDLHDDVGAKLLGLAISSQRANLAKEADLARSALQDLRDVVSRASQEHVRVSELLADWRIEAEQRLQAAGLALSWHFPAGDANFEISPEAALNLSRILREALTNVIRHAQAQRVEVSFTLDAETFAFSVSDDGIGCVPENVREHRGMNSMRARAEALDATLAWDSASPRGCRVRFAVSRAALTP